MARVSAPACFEAAPAPCEHKNCQRIVLNNLLHILYSIWVHIWIIHILFFTQEKISYEGCTVQFIQFALFIKLKLKLELGFGPLATYSLCSNIFLMLKLIPYAQTYSLCSNGIQCIPASYQSSEKQNVMPIIGTFRIMSFRFACKKFRFASKRNKRY